VSAKTEPRLGRPANSSSQIFHRASEEEMIVRTRTKNKIMVAGSALTLTGALAGGVALIETQHKAGGPSAAPHAARAQHVDLDTPPDATSNPSTKAKNSGILPLQVGRTVACDVRIKAHGAPDAVGGQTGLTAGSTIIGIGSRVQVVNPNNGKSVTVVVDERADLGCLALSQEAFDQIVEPLAGEPIPNAHVTLLGN